MHGVINKAIQSFLSRTYGVDLWYALARTAGDGIGEFEAMRAGGAQITARLLAAAERALDKPRNRILEDIGTWLVASGGPDTVRRLLRFGGVDFVEFLHSLDELPGRARLVLDEELLPQIEVRETAPSFYSVVLRGRGYGPLMLGILRAMADDYGTLAVIEPVGECPDCEEISVRVFKADYTVGREFVLCPS